MKRLRVIAVPTSSYLKQQRIANSVRIVLFCYLFTRMTVTVLSIIFPYLSLSDPFKVRPFALKINN